MAKDTSYKVANIGLAVLPAGENEPKPLKEGTAIVIPIPSAAEPNLKIFITMENGIIGIKISRKRMAELPFYA